MLLQVLDPQWELARVRPHKRGHELLLQVVDLLVDCDEDTLLVKAKRLGDGNVCHTGQRTCFNTRLE